MQIIANSLQTHDGHHNASNNLTSQTAIGKLWIPQTAKIWPLQYELKMDSHTVINKFALQTPAK